MPNATEIKNGVFTEDNVTMLHAKDGSIPQNYNNLILKEVIQNSKVMQLGKFEEMDNLEKKFTFTTDGPGAYWVGEGQKIKTSKPTIVQAKLTAKKLGVIIPVSREYLNYTQADFFEAVRPKIAEAFYKKFDEAVILNVDNPFPQSIEESIKAAGAGHTVKGGVNYDNVFAVEDAILSADHDVTAFISQRKNISLLRNANKVEGGVTVDRLFDRQANTLDGVEVVNLKSKSFEDGTLYAGDFDNLYYGIPYGMSYKISEEGQLSTLTNEDGTPVNLFEQELVALRVTMDVAMMIVKDDAFAKVVKSGK